MGYDIHLTRAAYCFDDDGAEITLDEWLAVVQADPDLTLDPENGPTDFLWKGEYPLHWWRGNIQTKNPETPLIEKMVSLAKLLNAKVQGDDGEVYPGDGKAPYHEKFCTLDRNVRSATLERSLLTSTIINLAQRIFDGRQFPNGRFDNYQLGILADALEDAGCDNRDILDHLRNGGEHVRGCWVIDLILSKD